MTTREKDTVRDVPVAETGREGGPPVDHAPAAHDPMDSQDDGLSAPSELPVRYRSIAEPMDVILRKLTEARPMVPNSLEEGHAYHAVHEPPRSAGRVDDADRVIVAASRAPLPGAAARLGAPGQRAIPTFALERRAKRGGRILPATAALAALVIGGSAALIAWRGHTTADTRGQTVTEPEPAARAPGAAPADERAPSAPSALTASAEQPPRAAPGGDSPPPAVLDGIAERASKAARSAAVPSVAAADRPSARTPARSTSRPGATSDVEAPPAASARRPRTEEEKRAIDHGVVFEEP